jgi:hypothetical protein
MAIKSDVKFFAVGIIAGVVTLFLPVILWNVLFLDYIDKQGKLVAWCLAPIFAAVSAGIIVGFTDINKRLFNSGETNPYWGWFAVALAIECVIVALSNT